MLLNHLYLKYTIISSFLIYIHSHTYIHMCENVYICIYICTHIYVYENVCIYAYITYMTINHIKLNNISMLVIQIKYMHTTFIFSNIFVILILPDIIYVVDILKHLKRIITKEPIFMLFNHPI